jgi:hypothetical protein
VRRTLPERDVTEATIEDAFVRFIFYCNPGLPLYPDTQSLREAFRNPPRSGGRIFSPYRVYELVKEFYQKDIKTWTELTIKLGVEPPDPSKDESTQKVAQYGVRLKVEIPTPICLRDGRLLTCCVEMDEFHAREAVL